MERLGSTRGSGITGGTGISGGTSITGITNSTSITGGTSIFGGTGATGITGGTSISGGTGRAAPRSARGRLCRQQRAGARVLLPVLCLALALALPPPARALPPPLLPRYRLAAGLNCSRELREAVDASLHRLKELGTLGFECTLEEVDLEDITKNRINTIKACISEDPGAGNCPGLERSTFDRSKCLEGIYEDLNVYRAELKNFDDQKVLSTIDEMMKVLRTSSQDMPQPSAGAGLTSFKERMRLCSILHAFQIRTVTINRLINYMSSPESSL